MSRFRRAVIAALVMVALVLVTAPLAACSSGSGAKTSPSSTRTGAALPGGEGETSTAATTKVTPRTTHRVTTLSKTMAPTTTTPKPLGKLHEHNRACPYLSNQKEAVAEGKAVGRSTVLTADPKSTKVVGCRYYLAYPDYHAVTQITVMTYPTEIAAFNTVAHTGGSTAQSTPGIGDGAVLYRTAFYRPDGTQDWSCIFAKGKTVVTIHTDELHSSVDARNVAVAIVGKF